MNVKFITSIKSCLLTSVFILLSYKNLLASQEFKESHEESLYKQGLAYRDAENSQEAIECFLPLAKKDYVKAQHNLAMQYYNRGADADAYVWFKRASNLNFTPSQNNLARLNLLCALLPDELITNATSYLCLKDLFSFKAVSHRTQKVVDLLLIHTEFLNSPTPFAQDFISLFKDVTFGPLPQSIRIVRSVDATDSFIEVRFRNSQHLREIVNHTPLIKTQKKIYYVRDEAVEDGNEFRLLGGQLETSYAIHINSDEPLSLEGDLQLNYEMHLPPYSNYNGLNYKGRSISTGKLRAYLHANNIATMIDKFNEDLFKLRTMDAAALLKTQQKKRCRFPDSFPEFQDLCPDLQLVSRDAIKISSKDYIEASKPLIYIADSIPALEELRKRLPEFGTSIGYVDGQSTTPGVYCVGPLSLIKGFKISTANHLMIAGALNLPDYNITFKTTEGIWGFGPSIRSSSLTLSSKTLTIGALHTPMENNMKPDDMPEEEWRLFLNEGQLHGFLEYNDDFYQEYPQEEENLYINTDTQENGVVAQIGAFDILPPFPKHVTF